jgi:hypothetical protein
MPLRDATIYENGEARSARRFLVVIAIRGRRWDSASHIHHLRSLEHE